MKKNLRAFLQTYWTFTRTELNGILVLLLLLLLLLAARIYLQYLPAEANLVPEDLKQQLEDWENSVAETLPSETSFPDPQETTPALFAFDPNQVSYEELQKLGFPDWLAKRVIRYREKGGKFRKAADLQKLYGMRPDLYERIAPFIRVPAGSESTTFPPKTIRQPHLPEKIELNSADSALLLQLQGIGPGFSSRIIRYRKALGGFTDTRQLLEIYGFRPGMLDTIAEKIFLDRSGIHKLAVNTCDEKTLFGHPYIRKKARIIINYRNQHGPFGSAEDLAGILILSPEELEKILPYLSFE